jgi:hypothetical protein
MSIRLRYMANVKLERGLVVRTECLTPPIAIERAAKNLARLTRVHKRYGVAFDPKRFIAA